MYSFETPESPGGLYINLKTYQVPRWKGTESAEQQLHARQQRTLSPYRHAWPHPPFPFPGVL
jgi:hypothetical protein